MTGHIGLILSYKIEEVYQEIADTYPKQFAEELAKLAPKSFPSMYCMDIAESGGELYFLEVGAVSCAGLYSCDMHEVVGAMALAHQQLYLEM